MTDNFEKAFALTLELEGLLALVQNRQDMIPAQVYTMMRAKVEEIGALLAPTPAIEPAVQPEQVQTTELTEPVVVVKEEKVSESGNGDLLKIFSLNDKFLYRRELFNNSQQAFDETLAVLTTIPTAEEITDYLVNDLCLDPENAAVKSFMDKVIGYLDNRC